MNRIDSLFRSKGKNILSVYFTAGFPQLEDTCKLIKNLEEFGADMIEVGFPFSDPLADGPVIQKSNNKAIENGMTLQLLFEQLKTIREQVQIPLVLMGYLNPVLQFGEERFVEKCIETGIDGVILPDCPAEYFEEHLQTLFDRHNLKNVLLVTPETTVSRMKYLDSVSSGFLYVVSSNTITGFSETSAQQTEYFQRVQNESLANPRMIGFGIQDVTTFQNACHYANGAIIGSAFIQHIAVNGTGKNSVQSFIQTFRS